MSVRGRTLLFSFVGAVAVLSNVPLAQGSSAASPAESGADMPAADTIAPRGDDSFSYADLSDDEARDFDDRLGRENDLISWASSEVASRFDLAGMWFGDGEGTTLVLAVTTEETAKEVEAQIPDKRKDSVKVQVVQFREAELLDQTRRIVSNWKEISGSQAVLVAAVPDLETGSISLGYADETDQFDSARTRDHAAAQVDARVHITRATRGNVETVCSSRTNCYSPMRAGIVIRRGSTSGAGCTMGFNIQVGSDEQFVSAGHCSYGSFSDSWYHPGFGYVGAVTRNLYGGGGMDAMRVQMSDSQDSYIVYGSFSTISSARNPVKNESACISKGATNVVTCGTITSTSFIYFAASSGGGCGCYLTGFDASWSTSLGDSGSPVQSGSVAIGINATAGGYMAPMGWVLQDLGASIRT